MTRVAVVTPDVVGARMAGPGIRAFHFATELARHFDVVLVAQLQELEPQGFETAAWGSAAARAAMRSSDVLIGQPRREVLSARHPRATGTYAKLIEEYVVRDRKLTLQEMIRKATGFPAQILGLRNRGVVRRGAKADLVLFDPARVRGRSTFVEPLLPAEGFDLVLVNGRRAFAEGMKVGTSGALLRAR